MAQAGRLINRSVAVVSRANVRERPFRRGESVTVAHCELSVSHSSNIRGVRETSYELWTVYDFLIQRARDLGSAGLQQRELHLATPNLMMDK